MEANFSKIRRRDFELLLSKMESKFWDLESIPRNFFQIAGNVFQSFRQRIDSNLSSVLAHIDTDHFQPQNVTPFVKATCYQFLESEISTLESLC